MARSEDPQSLNVRWSTEDKLAKLPQRFDAALEKCGFSMTRATLALIRAFTEELEDHGCPAIFKKSAQKAIGGSPVGTALRYSLNEPPAKYGGKKGKGKK